MTLTKYLSASYLLLLVIFLPQIMVAQKISDDNWLKSNDRGNRFEGRYEKNISNPALELVSFWAGFESYEFGSNQELKVAFRLPDTTQFAIKAEEILTQEFYWMQNKQGDFSPGWNEFSPWPVDFLLKEFSIRPNNLGIVIKATDKNLPTYVPAFVYHSNEAEEPNFLAMIFRLGVTISEGKAKIYKGKTPVGKKSAPADLLHEQKLGKRFSGASMPIRIDKKVLAKDNSWYTFTLELNRLNSTEKITHILYFYYEPEK